MKNTNKPESDTLTKRETEILPLIADGLSSKQIAGKLFVSISTVSNHRANILHKTHCKNCLELIKYAIKAGLIAIV